MRENALKNVEIIFCRQKCMETIPYEEFKVIYK